MGNFCESVAVAVTRGAQLKPHMDRQNDSHEQHNVMGALTFAGRDEEVSRRGLPLHAQVRR